MIGRLRSLSIGRSLGGNNRLSRALVAVDFEVVDVAGADLVVVVGTS